MQSTPQEPSAIPANSKSFTVEATILIENGEATVSIPSDLGLPSGTKIPLKHQNGASISVLASGGSQPQNGHSII